jgi:hypothetical protein
MKVLYLKAISATLVSVYGQDRVHLTAQHHAERGYKRVLNRENFSVEIDWLKATEDQRKQLYVATRAVADAADITVEAIIDAALGRKVLMGADYISTFRRGKIRRSYAKLVYGWIVKRHLQTAQAIATDLFPLPHADAWEELIDTKAIHGELRIARFGRASMGLVQRADKQPKPTEVLKLGEEFCFHIETGMEGYLTAYQGYRDQWHLLPLGADGAAITLIQQEAVFLPMNDEGQPVPLVENEDVGYHRFVIIIAKEERDLPTPEQPHNGGANVVVHEVLVQFVS